jgi:hypothetical protein
MGQESLKPAGPPANQTMAPPSPNSVAAQLQPPNSLDNFLDDDDFEGPPPGLAPTNTPHTNAPGRAEYAGMARQMNSGPATQQAPATAAVNPHTSEPQHTSIWLMAGQNSVAATGDTHPEMCADLRWHQVPNQAPAAAPTPAPAPPPATAPPPPPQPSRPAETHHKDGGPSGFGTSGSTGHGNWTGGDHPSHGNVT